MYKKESRAKHVFYLHLMYISNFEIISSNNNGHCDHELETSYFELKITDSEVNMKIQSYCHQNDQSNWLLVAILGVQIYIGLKMHHA